MTPFAYPNKTELASEYLSSTLGFYVIVSIFHFNMPVYLWMNLDCSQVKYCESNHDDRILTI